MWESGQSAGFGNRRTLVQIQPSRLDKWKGKPIGDGIPLEPGRGLNSLEGSTPSPSAVNPRGVAEARDPAKVVDEVRLLTGISFTIAANSYQFTLIVTECHFLGEF